MNFVTELYDKDNQQYIKSGPKTVGIGNVEKNKVSTTNKTDVNQSEKTPI